MSEIDELVSETTTLRLQMEALQQKYEAQQQQMASGQAGRKVRAGTLLKSVCVPGMPC